MNTASQMWPHQSLETEKQENCWSGVLQGRLLWFWGGFVIFLLLKEPYCRRGEVQNYLHKHAREEGEAEIHLHTFW